jgi:hypothetical protein
MRKTPTVRPVRRSRVHSLASAVSATAPLAALPIERLETRMMLSDTPLVATPAAQVLLNNATWTSVGPTTVTNGQVPGSQNVSGRITGLAVDPNNADIYYVGSADGGLFKTTDGGTTWTALTDLQPSLVTGAVALAPSNPQVVYVGLGETSNSEDSFYGKGILRSLDGGTTWLTEGQQFTGQTIARIAVDPDDPGTVLAAVNDNGVNGDPTATAGIYMSTNGGLTWTDTTTNYASNNDYYDVIFNPSNPEIAYATFSSLTNGQNGIYETDNGGASWTVVSIGTSIEFGRISLAISPAAPDTIYAAIENNFSGDLGGDANGEYYPGFIAKSTDGGATFTAESGIQLYSTQGFYDNAIAVDPTNADIVYVAGSTDGTVNANGNFLNGVLESDDGGTTFNDITVGTAGNNGPEVASHALAVTASGALLDGTDGGLWRLDSNFASGTVAWSDLNTGLGDNQIQSVALSATTPGEIVAGVGGLGIGDGIISSDGSTTYTQGNTILAANAGTGALNIGGNVAIDPSNGQIVYATSPDDGEQDFVGKSTNGGLTFTEADTGITDEANAQVYPPIAVDPQNGQRVLVGTDGVWESLDGATTWTEVGIPATNNFNPNDDPVTAIAVGNAGNDGPVIYAATYSTTDGGELFFTDTDGASWTEVDLPSTNLTTALQGSELTTAGEIDKIVVDNLNSGTAYVVEDGFAGDGSATTTGGHIFETNNAGASWNDISGNLPNSPFHTLAVLPTGQNGFYHTLYAGGDGGVYVSYDDGYVWQTLGAGLPNAIVEDLEVDPATGVLAAGTYGRGIYEISTAFPGATIGNFVFDDVNASSEDVASTDPGVANATLELYSPGADGIVGTADDTLVATTTSNSEGAYAFTDVPSGSYYIHVIPPTGYYISPSVVPTTTNNNVLQSSTSTPISVTTLGNSANQSTGDTGLITVTGGTVFPTQSTAGSIGMYEQQLTISSPYIGRPQNGTGVLNFVVSIGPANSTTVTIPYTTANGTAIAGTDYQTTSGTLTFTPGVTSLTVPVVVLPSTTVQQNLTVILNVSPPTSLVSAETSGTGLIINDNFPVATAAPVTVTVNSLSPQTVPVTITLSTAAPFATSVQYNTVAGSAGPGADFTATSGTVTFAAGQTSATVDVTVLANSTPSLTRTFTLELSFPVALTLTAASDATITILETSSPAFSVNSPAVTESLTGTTVLPFTVSLASGQPATTTISYTTQDGTALAGVDYTAESGTLTFPPGRVSEVVDIPVARFFGPAADKTLSLVLSDPGTGTSLDAAATTGTGTIIDLSTALLPFGGKTKAVYTDNIGQKVTVQMSGSGTGSVVFLGSTSVRTDAFEIVTTGTSPTSILTVSVAGGGQTTVTNLLVDSSIGTINAKTLNVTGTATITGSAYAVNLGYIAGSALAIGAGEGGSVALAFRRVTNGTITSAIPIRTLTAGAYIDTSGSPSVITAPSVGAIKVTGNFGGTVDTDSVSSIRVSGTLTGTINATDSIGSVTAGSIVGGTINAGIEAGLTALPASEADFINKSSSIGSVSAGTFSDSDISSWDVQSVRLKKVQTTAGGQTFGVSGGVIGKVKAKATGGQSITGNDVTTPRTISNFKVGAV